MKAGIACPSCGFPGTSVTDSRPADDGIRRRRLCSSCGARFGTVELLREEADTVNFCMEKGCLSAPVRHGFCERHYHRRTLQEMDAVKRLKGAFIH